MEHLPPTQLKRYLTLRPLNTTCPIICGACLFILTENANTSLSTIRTEERETSFEWIGKVTDLNTSLYAKAGSNITLDSLEDAKQYSVTVMKNDFFQEY